MLAHLNPDAVERLFGDNSGVDYPQTHPAEMNGGLR